MSRKPIPYSHDELRRQVIAITRERPLYEFRIQVECGIFSNKGNFVLKHVLKSMVADGTLETWDGLYCYMKDLGGCPMRVYV